MSEDNQPKASDERMKVIVVDSVKGGCGKTTVALKYAMKFAQAKAKVCYIDLDILGSSIEVFISGCRFVASPKFKNKIREGDAPYQLDVEKTAQFYLNELFKGEKFGDCFFNKIKVIENNASNPYSFDLIACNPDQNEKDLFKPSRLMNYAGQIDYEYFAAMIEKMIDGLEHIEYTHVIIDMPPNSDAYTDSVFDILLRADEIGKKKIKNLENVDSDEKAKYDVVTKYNVEICIINSLDRAHFEANLVWINAMIAERRMEWALNPELNFKIVFNNVSGIKREDSKNYLENRLRQLKDIFIKKVTYFGHDRLLAINAMNDYELGFDNLEEKEIK